MLIITVHVNAPAGQAIGIKEQIAQDLERYGDTRVVSVEVVKPTDTELQEGETDIQEDGKRKEEQIGVSYYDAFGIESAF